MKNILIGLTGVAEDVDGNRIGSARVGKDEIAGYLTRNSPNWYQESFASPIYKIVHEAFGVPLEILQNPSEHQKEEHRYEPWDMTMRQMLQTVGSELFRHHVDEDFWVKSLTTRLEADFCNDRHACHVVSDVRMENEARAIRSRSGVIIHVHRKISGGKVRPHETEQTVGIVEGDRHIYNYGTIDELHRQIEAVILSF